MEGCGLTTIKYLMVAFNFVLLIIGICLIAIGATVEMKFKEWMDVMPEADFNAAAILFIVVGVFIFLTAFFGCFGAWREVKWMVGVYTVILVILFIMQVGGFIAAFTKKGEAKELTQTGLNRAIGEANPTTDAHKYTLKFFDSIQKELQCCGVESFKDWNRNTYYNGTGVPTSCCAKEDGSCPKCGNKEDCVKTNDEKQLYTTGCLDKATELAQANINHVAVAGVIFCLLQLIGIIFSCCLLHNIHRKDHEAV